MKKEVDVYTQPDCPPCQIVKEFLHHYHIAFNEYNIKKDPAAFHRLTNEFNSFSTPTVVIDGHVVAGFDIKELERLLDL
ncbi:glutaredoxin domain-containing protein [Bacillus sp. 165]|uniref:glutaredoxin domain-containing protein n=1 Tax=Bacillus sp. 165 TaxID=1529117 RepID=UPI001ADC5DEC|nr:glutaredoxin domain-containing protein [Bacillus sp. 165]MBO9130355.1 NrdH-redoxin [Bacillus sp. 165]